MGLSMTQPARYPARFINVNKAIIAGGVAWLGISLISRARARAAGGARGELPVSTTDGFERAFNPACASGKDGLPARFADNRLARESIPNFERCSQIRIERSDCDNNRG